MNTPRKITDGNKKVRWSWPLASFGATNPNENPSGLGTFKYNLRASWQIADVETGLNYNTHRYYSPPLGRYTQADPIGLAGGNLSLYTFVNNNPLSFIDPDGLRCTYSQSSQSLRCVNDITGQEYLTCRGYSGNGAGLNNPDAQNRPHVGPLPRGRYTVGSSTTRRGPVTRPLTPDPSNNMEGRSGFLIHGDNSRNDNSASEGCIITPRRCREDIPVGETLEVVR